MIPQQLNDIIEDFSFITDRHEHAAYITEIADRFPAAQIKADMVTQPYDEQNKVPACESEAYVWAFPNADGTLSYYFAVQNPQGLSAMAMAVILHESCTSTPLAQVVSIPDDVIFKIFGQDISMGRGEGLMNMVRMVKSAAQDMLNS